MTESHGVWQDKKLSAVCALLNVMRLPARPDISGVSSQGMISAFGLISDQLRQVKELISSSVCDNAPVVIRETVCLIRDTIFGGKMLRPGLVLLTGACFGSVSDVHVRTAAIVEIIHNATLLHDDVMDEGQRRRGAATINNLRGNESAVLLGDFLLSAAFKMCSDLEPRLIKIIAAAAAQTCEGELRQITQRQNWQLSESEYIDIITRKSATLFSSSSRLGALSAEAGEREVESLADFGRNVGIAFQITDDLLDIVGDESKMGKTLGSDVAKNKLTLAVIHLLRTVGNKEKGEAIEILSATGGDKKALSEKLRSYGSLEYARCRAQEFVSEAVASLADVKEGDAKSALIETARFAANRVV